MYRTWSKLGLGGLLLGCLGMGFTFDVLDYFNLSTLQSLRGQLGEHYINHPVQTLGAFMLVYIATVALSLPAGLILSLTAGSLFGLIPGTLAVSFAGAIGATCSMMISRWLFRDLVQQRLGERVVQFNEGLEKNGAFYLLSLRLLPVVPSSLVNLGMGLAPVKVSTFYWVSQVGMLLITLVFVNAGVQLSQIQSLNDVLSLPLVATFCGLALLPLVAKRLVGRT